MVSPKVIIVTGASRGIGLAAARYLLKEGHRLIVTARTKNTLDELNKEYPDQVQILVGDHGDDTLGAQAHDLAIGKWNRLDGLILNHGTLDPVDTIGKADIAQWKSAFDVNFFSFLSTASACLPSLRQSNGRIVMVSSGAALSGYHGWGAYGAAKAAVNHLAKTLAVEEPNVITIALRPGVVDTEMQRAIREKHSPNMDKEQAEKFHSLKASGGLLRPEQPSHVIAKLALAADKSLSGQFVSWNDEPLKEFQES